MNIKFKYLNLYYIFTAIIAPICICVLIVEPDVILLSHQLNFLCLATLIALGATGFLLAILEKTKTIKISYSAEDKERMFYKIIQVAEKLTNN